MHPQKTGQATRQTMLDDLQPWLFPTDGERTYALVDGASCDELLARLDEWQPDYACLYDGALDSDLAEVVPYLIELRPGHAFTPWLLGHFHGRHWGIFARSPAGLRALRGHFRSLLRVRGPDDTLLFFRYYDPRVLTIFLPTTDARERERFFGEVSVIFSENEQGDLVAFRCGEDALGEQVVLRAEVFAGT